VVIGTVKGDLHDIGKNLVASMLEGGGFEVLDLGTDVAPEKFIEAVKARHANIVCLSALLTVTMPAMRTAIDATHVRIITNGYYKSGAAPNFSATLAGATAIALAGTAVVKIAISNCRRPESEP